MQILKFPTVWISLAYCFASTPAAQHPSTVWGAVDASAEFVGGPGSNFVVDDATGGAGYETAKALAARGWRIRAMHRDPQKVSALLPDAAWVPGDAMRRDDVVAAAVGCDGWFVETHPRPLESPSDGPNMIPLEHLRETLERALAVRAASA